MSDSLLTFQLLPFDIVDIPGFSGYLSILHKAALHRPVCLAKVDHVVETIPAVLIYLKRVKWVGWWVPAKLESRNLPPQGKCRLELSWQAYLLLICKAPPMHLPSTCGHLSNPLCLKHVLKLLQPSILLILWSWLMRSSCSWALEWSRKKIEIWL